LEQKVELENIDFMNTQAVIQAFSLMNPVDIAEVFEDLDVPDEQVIKLFRLLPKDIAAEVFAYLEPDTQQNIVVYISDKEISSIMDDLFIDDAVDFIEEMPANVVKRVLAVVPLERRETINHFLKYKEDSAGSVMTIEYIALKRDSTVKAALDEIRKTGWDKETIYTCYVIERDRRLCGTISLRKLLLNDDSVHLETIMNTKIISTTTDTDKETVANDFRKYSLLSMPVVDTENRLIGIVTVDDVLTVQEEEATEDFEIMAALSPSEEPYLKTSVWQLTRHRVVWLLLLMLSATLTGSIISSFEDGLAALPALVAFIPMLMDTGGNAGSQSSTLIIRGMALNELEPSDILLVIWKEIRVALLCGLTLVAANFARIILMHGDPMIAVTVSLALLCTVIMAKVVGCVLPIIAKKCRLDPAVMASPVITTIVDACALIVYFLLAKQLLHI
jgi:magnesium transporter